MQIVFQKDDFPKKVVRGRSVSKNMIVVSFRRSGAVAVIPLEQILVNVIVKFICPKPSERWIASAQGAAPWHSFSPR